MEPLAILAAQIQAERLRTGETPRVVQVPKALFELYRIKLLAVRSTLQPIYNSPSPGQMLELETSNVLPYGCDGWTVIKPIAESRAA